MNRLKILFIVLLIFALPALAKAKHKLCAVEGVVSGKVTNVGYRAALLKVAIKYQLAGWVHNVSEGSVSFNYQGQCKNVEKATGQLMTVDPKACVNSVTINKAPLKSNFNTFTIYAWTSSSRCFYTPVDIVYTLGSNKSYHDLIDKYKPKGGWKCDKPHPPCS